MKYLFSIFFIIIASITAFSQQKPMYLQQRTPPPAVLLLADSSTKWQLKARLQKDKPLFILFFNTECDHCQHETEQLIKNIDKFKDIQIVMATTKSLTDMKTFIAQHKLNKYPQITVGRDVAYIMPSFYEMKNLPYLAFYDKNKKLISTFEGALGIEGILKIFGK